MHLVLAVFAGLLAFGWLIVSPPGDYDKGIGLWFNILASIGLLVGAVMEHLESDHVADVRRRGWCGS